MIPSIHISDKQTVKTGAICNGCQRKYLIDGYWYKADSVGMYEAFAEVAASRIAHILNVNMPIVDYSLCTITTAKTKTSGCCSASFLDADSVELSMQRILELNGRFSRALPQVEPWTPGYKLDCMLDMLKRIDAHLIDQLACMFQFDRLIKNGDRHEQNIVLRYSGSAADLVLFDNGDSCTSDTVLDFPEEMNAIGCIMHNNTAKPFLLSYDHTCSLLQNFSKFQLCAVTNVLQLSDLQESVPAWFYLRVTQFLTHQFKHYLGVDLKIV